MGIILLMGTSSAGKTTLCKELKDKHQFHIVKNGDEIIAETYYPKIIKELEQTGIMDQLSPYMKPDEMLRFCLTKQLNMSKEIHIKNQMFKDPEFLNLETILQDAGVDQKKIPELAAALRSAADIQKTVKGPSWDDLVKAMHDQVFDPANRDKNVVIDIVPELTTKETAAELEKFQEYVDKFRYQNPDVTVELYKVFAYCPPQELSKRMDMRNQKAEEENNSMDKRVGISPFYLLTSLVTAEDQPDATPLETILSKDELFDIVNKHTRYVSKML